MSTVTVSPASFDIQEGAVTLEHAIIHASDNGVYTANLLFDEVEFMSKAHDDVDAFDDYIVGALIEEAQPYLTSYRILGVAEPGTLVVEVSQHLDAFLIGADASDLEGVSTEALSVAVARFGITGENSAAGVLADRLAA